eukprot:m.1642094 g.1642094  ORF g.1642094 m.1642094 type:complete len:57 (+) comp51542_c0_seq1:46-216(+)
MLKKYEHQHPSNVRAFLVHQILNLIAVYGSTTSSMGHSIVNLLRAAAARTKHATTY